MRRQSGLESRRTRLGDQLAYFVFVARSLGKVDELFAGSGLVILQIETERSSMHESTRHDKSDDRRNVLYSPGRELALTRALFIATTVRQFPTFDMRGTQVHSQLTPL